MILTRRTLLEWTLSARDYTFDSRGIGFLDCRWPRIRDQLSVSRNAGINKSRCHGRGGQWPLCLDVPLKKRSEKIGSASEKIDAVSLDTLPVAHFPKLSAWEFQTRSPPRLSAGCGLPE